ncbi:MAG TPA: hypothetical protein VHB01_10785 [Nitrosospira sp.]|nr:hypothetical protein [Nitrosospira sp.]
MKPQQYVGVDKDEDGGLTHMGRIVLDAWAFGILPEVETCAGWDAAQMQNLYEKVYDAWEPYAHLPSRLPDELRQRHAEIYARAINNARTQGWDAEIEDED